MMTTRVRSYLRLCVYVGVVGDELLDHVRLSGERRYVEGRVPFLLSRGEKTDF